MRIFIISDIHIDFLDNRRWIEQLSRWEYTQDVLILAGDVSDRLHRLEETFSFLCSTFSKLFFVPGNHELWVRGGEAKDSVEKFEKIRGLCCRMGVCTTPQKVGNIWVVPLFSWYLKPEEGEGSLFMEKPGEDPDFGMWGDDHFTRWDPSIRPADYLLSLNQQRIEGVYDAPVISVSHFLPRQELIFGTDSKPILDSHPSFNFSRVAGCIALDQQIRRLGSQIHIYGHQHRNRDRVLDGIRYISHCLGYQHEREKNQIRGIEQGLKQICPTIGF